MLDIAADLASWILIVLGVFFLVVGALGLLRMPDIYTRAHGASLIDSLGSLLLILGLMVQAGPTLITVKLAMIYVVLFFTTPVASHAVAQAAIVAGFKPELAEDRTVAPIKPDGMDTTPSDAPARET